MLRLIALLIAIGWATPAWAALSATERFELGQRHLKRGNYLKALEQFNHLRNYFRDDPLAIDAELGIADVYFKQGEWDQARIYYDQFRRRHPKHSRIDYADFRVALSFYKRSPKTAQRDQRYTEQAVREWTEFIQKHPESSLLEESTLKRKECIDRLAKRELEIASFYKKRGAWDAVRRRTEFLIQNYPTSKLIADALELKVWAHVELDQNDDFKQALSQLKAIAPDKAASLDALLKDNNNK